MNIIPVPAHSNNYGKGRNGEKIQFIVLHWMDGTLKGTDATFQNPTRGTSAHYGIGQSEVHQYVLEADTAYHCGNLTINRQSIGIEHEGSYKLPITDNVYKLSAELIAGLVRKYSIPLNETHIKIHKEIKATACPGTLDRKKLISMVRDIMATDTMKPYIKSQLRDELQIDVDASEGDFRAAVSTVKSKVSDHGNLTEQVKSLKDENAQVRGFLTELSEKNKNAEVEIAELEVKLDDANKTLGAREAAINELQGKLTAQEQAFNTERQTLQDEISRLKGESPYTTLFTLGKLAIIEYRKPEDNKK